MGNIMAAHMLYDKGQFTYGVLVYIIIIVKLWKCPELFEEQQKHWYMI